MGDGDDRKSGRLTWAALITTVCAGLASAGGAAGTAAAAAPSDSDPPSIENRILAVRETLRARIAEAAEAGEEDSQQLAQWYNFPNYWNNAWRNW